MVIDINCDMGEGMDNDALIMPFIHSANISCGYHAGDETSIRKTIALAMKYGVRIGAHPSFADRENFGRREMILEESEVYDLVSRQLLLMENIVKEMGADLYHVKPHGALYNMSARDPQLARVIAGAIKDFNPSLVLYGLSGSHSIEEANYLGLQCRNEVFADRTYQDDGSLTPRNHPRAMVQTVEECLAQVKLMATEGKVISVSGKEVNIIAETICVHGDGAHAVEFVRAISENLNSHA